MLKRLDWNVVFAGALMAAVIVVPVALISRAAGADADTWWIGVSFAAILVGFGLGGALAARAANFLPLTHAAAGALVAFGGVQLVGVIRRLIADDAVNVATIVFSGFLALSASLLGGLIMLRRKWNIPERRA